MPFILLSAVCALFVSCTNDLKDVMALPKNELSPSQIGDTVTMIYTDSSQLKVMLKANRMLVFEKNVSEPFKILPNGFFVTFFEDDKISATLKANYGVQYDVSKKMEAKYAVEVVNRDGTKLETEKLIWNELTKKIYTNAFVKITTETEIITGVGMESNQDFTKYQLKKIVATLQLKDDE
ncbi:LPS export ABC transporter periplasmic protein LptC [Aurantibacillus circumpalustris]|uniref:LPS export ABC transporter periplasmic protein LptC n=1 Tax=Aurantibacillus circumpalustris TaxID=3036359 RepID=UPI00295A62B8|nr:LPS export ABC transporter periplasmic protein LptC [Aurantibacillus circumpalustris]